MLVIAICCGPISVAIGQKGLQSGPPTLKSAQMLRSVRRGTRVAILHGMNSGYARLDDQIEQWRRVEFQLVPLDIARH